MDIRKLDLLGPRAPWFTDHSRHGGREHYLGVMGWRCACGEWVSDLDPLSLPPPLPPVTMPERDKDPRRLSNWAVGTIGFLLAVLLIALEFLISKQPWGNSGAGTGLSLLVFLGYVTLLIVISELTFEE